MSARIGQRVIIVIQRLRIRIISALFGLGRLLDGLERHLAGR